MPMFNLIEYKKKKKKKSKIIGSFLNFYRDEPNSGLTGAATSIKDFKLKILNLLITKQVLQQN